MLDTFLITEPDKFSAALGFADNEESTNQSRQITWQSTMVKAIEEAALLETVTIGEEEIDPQIEIPMTDTTFMLPKGISVNNASFNDKGKFHDLCSLVSRYVSVSDFVDDTEFESYKSVSLEKMHNKRMTQHGAFWVVFTMGVNKTEINLNHMRGRARVSKGTAFSFKKG